MLNYVFISEMKLVTPNFCCISSSDCSEKFIKLYRLKNFCGNGLKLQL